MSFLRDRMSAAVPIYVGLFLPLLEPIASPATINARLWAHRVVALVFEHDFINTCDGSTLRTPSPRHFPEL